MNPAFSEMSNAFFVDVSEDTLRLRTRMVLPPLGLGSQWSGRRLSCDTINGAIDINTVASCEKRLGVGCQE